MNLRRLQRVIFPGMFDKFQVKERLKDLEKFVSDDFMFNTGLIQTNSIICEGDEVPINWNRVVNLKNEDALIASDSNFSKRTKKPHMIVTHWDVTKNACSCYKVLERVGLSSHFVIDNDGTIYQMVDTKYKAWHAGKVNNFSIGIDISNAYYPKKKIVDYYNKNFGPRPILKNVKVHGKRLKPFFGFYTIQLMAYKRLVKALCQHYDIIVDYPKENGKLLTKVYKPAKKGKFSGVVAHYHVSRNKIDTAGLEFDKVLKGL